MNERKVLDWLADHQGGNRSCRLCGHDQHQVFPCLQAALSLKPSTNQQGPSVPMVQVMCQNCGLVRLFAAQKVPYN